MEYSALDTDANEIRLLTLLPDDENSRVCCTLMHVSLINPPEYVALSYCWGDQALTREITINGIQVKITTNLESALHHLFCHYKCLWVDAICINQQDKAERSQRRCWGDPKCLFQTLSRSSSGTMSSPETILIKKMLTSRYPELLWMGSIYRRAEKVAAWVGVEFDHSDLAVDFIQKFQPHQTHGRGSAEQLIEVELPPATQSAFLKLLDQPYWRRVWIVQEIALSPLTIVHCGRLYFPWKSLASAVKSIRTSHSSYTLPAKSFASNDTLAMKPSVLKIWNLNQFNMDVFESKPVRFFEALHRSLDALSTEPRDRVFALLGLAYDAAMYLPVPNYRQSLRDISIGMAISGISTTRSLDLVPLPGRGCNNVSELPSWTPSWFDFDQKSSERQLKYLAQRRPRVENSKYGMEAHKYAAAGDTMAKARFSNEVLLTHAFLIDEVDGLSYTLSEGGKPLSFRNMSRSFPEDNLYHDNKSMVITAAEALSRGMMKLCSFEPQVSLALVCGNLKLPLPGMDPTLDTSPFFVLLQNPLGLSLTNNYLRDGESHLSGLLKLLIQSIECEPHSQDIIRRIWNETEIWKSGDPFALIAKSVREILKDDMRFMTTKKGYFGWAHPRAEQGDQIFLLSGCSVPVILRTKVEGGYTKVGDSYVQGIMFGELMGDDQDVPWTHIEIR